MKGKVKQLGLDNGITLKVRGELDFATMADNGEIPYWLHFDKNDYFKKEGWSEYEICYWRKWWGFRDEVVCALDMGEMDYEKELSISDVKEMRDILTKYLTGDYDRDRMSTIWAFDELVEHLGWDIVKLSWLIEFMKDNAGNIIVEFYDSY